MGKDKKKLGRMNKVETVANFNLPPFLKKDLSAEVHFIKQNTKAGDRSGVTNSLT